MRSSLLLSVALVAACAALPSWQGTQSITRTVAGRPDSVVAAATRALSAHGYTPLRVESTLIVTEPHELPQYARPVSTAPDTLPQQWLVQVQVAPDKDISKSNVTVTAFLVPRPLSLRDSVVQQRGVLVTARDQQLFPEVQRMGNWIVDEMRKP